MAKSYKRKTRKGAAKRFKVTATGKILRRTQNMRHLRANKSKKARRNYRRLTQLKGGMAKKVKKMLNI
ncbi:MAG: 50S ribosomal protein L35 [bacterium]|nr:50S ribosomal protein L35 [bacterium]